MKKTKLFKKLLSAVLSVTLSSQFVMASLPAEIFAVTLNTDYIIYSDEDVTINTNKAVLNGNIFSGDEFTYLGNDTCFVNKTLNADNSKGNITVKEVSDSRTKKPDYTAQLKNGIEYKVIETGDNVISAAKYDLSDYYFSTGKLRIDRTKFSGKGYIRAKETINYNAVQNEKGSEIFLYSEKGNITLQGADLTVDGILYAPNGTVELNAKNLTFNGTIVAKNVEFNGTNLVVNEIRDKSTSLIEFGPDLSVTANNDRFKENRKITLDISKSNDFNTLDTSSLSWSFTGVDGSSSANIKIDETTSTNIVKNLIITEKGSYRVTVSGKDKAGNSVKFYDVIDVIEDMAPVASFWKEAEVTQRDENGKTKIELEDTSYSLDGDEIGSRVWSVRFDSDNDGDFSDEEEVIFSTGNEEKVTYEAPSVGKYQFRLSVAEKLEDTIPSLISDSAYKTASTDGMKQEASVIEVVNEAPKSYAGISKAKNVDIVVTVGNAEAEDIEALNKNIAGIKEDLEKRGYSVKLSTVTTSTLTAKDTFAWTEYDHIDYRDSYVPSIHKHILYEEDSIRMVGYGVAALRDWLFVDDGIQAKRILSFDMIRDKTDWHSMEGGGFLFNTTIRDEVQPAKDEASEPVVIKKLNGYCILLTSGGFKLIQLSDINADSFRNGGVSSYAQTAGRVLMSVPVANAYDSYNVKIVANSRILSIYINDEPVIESFVLPDTETGTGFGPIICHASHCCGQQSYFTFSNIKMTTVNGSELSDVLDKFEWRDSAEHYVLNLSKQSVFDLNNEGSVGAAVKSLIEKETNFIGLGTADSKEQYDLLLRSADGVYMDWYDVIKDGELLKKYILSDLAGVDYSVKDNMISTSDEIVYENSFVDKENDPVGEQQWVYELNSSVYENSSKKSGTYTEAKPITVFDATGLYKIKSRLRDDPTNGNPALDPYKQWSDPVQWTDGLYVHSLPTASISTKIMATDDPNKFIAELTFEAQDADCLSHKNKGITAEKFEWKCVGDSEWQEGTVPSSVQPEKVYLQKYMVCDEQGAWSKPCVAVICAEKTENTEMFFDDEPPVVEIVVSDENPSVDDEIIISVSAKDNTEVASVNTMVGGNTVSKYQGSVTYRCETEGEFEIVVECEDIAGNKTIAKKTFTVTDRRDITAPKIIIDLESDLAITQDKLVTISGYIYDETEFGYYIAEFCPEDSEDYEITTQSPNEVKGGAITQFYVPDVGKYKFRVTAVDKAGNKSYNNILLDITRVDFSQGEQTTEPYQPPEHVDTPADITIEASKETAEVGEVVIVKVDAEDKDGLTSVKIYKDGDKIADSPVEFRFSESEAKVVTIKVETEDSKGGKSEKTLEIVFEDHRDKLAPTAEITSPENEASVSGKVAVNGSAYDETGMRLYTLEFKKADEKTFKSISSSYSERRDTELGVWDTYALDNGAYDLRLTVTDNGGNTTSCTVRVNVENGGSVDDDKLNEDLIVITKPEPNVKADGTIKVEAQVASVLNGKEYEITIKGTGDAVIVKHGTIGNDGAVSAVIDSSMFDDGVYTVTVAVKSTDSEGKDNSAKKDAQVIVKHSYESVDGKYECSIISPSDMEQLKNITAVTAKITEGVFNKYKFEYADAGDDNFIVFGTGTITNGTSVSADFDTTLLMNGYYDIRFTAYGDGIMAQDMITADVEGGLKIGNFSVSFDDVETELGGMPLTVTSTYDSRMRASSETLGYGWRINYNNVKLTPSVNQSRFWASAKSSSGFITRYTITETKKHRIKIDLGNGQTEEFVMKISPESQNFYPLEYGLNAYYVPVSGNGTTLVPCDITPNDLLFSGGELYTDDGVMYDPKRFIYTAIDGSKYDIDAKKGLISLTTADGDKYEFNENGIICSGKKAITFKHDGEGRITNISTASGKEVSYEYNIFGDLTAVTDVLGNRRTFNYTKHYLAEIYTGGGVRAVKNEYDDDGRLIRTTDANGNSQTYDHDVEGQTETVKDRNGNITRIVYDDDGNILAKTDPNGNTLKYSYDSNGMLTSKTDALGYVTAYKFDANGNLVETTNPEGIIISNQYNEKGLLKSVSVMGVETESYAYDNRGRLIGRTDANGNTTAYKYDGANVSSISDSIGEYVNITYKDGKALTAQNGDGTICTYVYDADGKCTSKTVTYIENGVEKQNTISYTYDAYGRVISTTDTDGNAFTTEYNEAGKPVTETDKNGAQTRYTYDKLGNLTTVNYPDGTRESFTYDKEGNKISATDRMGRKCEMTYDGVGNLVSKKYSASLEKTFKYDANNNLIEEKALNGAITRYEYDKAGRNTATIDALGNRTEYTYDAQSNKTSFKDALGNVYKYTYDGNGNLIKTEYPDGTSSSTEYNARGLVTSKTGRSGNKTVYTYDKLNRLASVTDALGGKTTYEYDEVGNLIKMTDANGNATQYAYDNAGRLIKAVDAMGQSAEYTYDKNGNILTFSDFGGKVTSYTYNAKNNRLNSKRTSDGTTSYGYNNEGAITYVNSPSGSISYAYNSLGALTKVTYPGGRYIEYTYDDFGALVMMSTANSKTSYTRDLLGRVLTVTDSNGGVTSYEYDANGNCIEIAYPNKVTMTYEFDELGRPVSETAVYADSDALASYEYTYGKSGETTHIKELDKDIYYEYDELCRLVTEKTVYENAPTQTITYTYDAVGNRTSKTVGSKKTEYKYNALNQLISGDGITYLYDASGNLVSAVSDSSKTTYKYSGDNMLIEADVNGAVEKYTYDFNGNRLTAKSDSSFTFYLNDPTGSVSQTIEELDANNNAKCIYTRGLGLISQNRGGNISYYVSDAHDNVRLLTDGKGYATDSYDYDAWGNLTSSKGFTENTRYYCGEPLDSTTGLYYLRARYMDPKTGTFTTLDTYQGSNYNPVTLNKYLYANGNPVMNVDPTGHFSLVNFAIGFTMSLVVDLVWGTLMKDLLDGFVKSAFGNAGAGTSVSSTGSGDYAMSGNNRKLGFEELFQFNLLVINTTFEINCIAFIRDALSFMKSEFSHEYKDLIGGSVSILQTTKGLAESLAKRYELYEYIFDYALYGDDVVIEKMQEFTFENISTYRDTLTSFMNSGYSGDFGKGRDAYEGIKSLIQTGIGICKNKEVTLDDLDSVCQVAAAVGLWFLD